MSVVTLITDFGTADGYVGEMKGVVLRLAPGAQLVDLTHEIAPGDIAAASYALGRAWPAFPEGTVHLAVVDPGVGTGRRALAVAAGGQFFVGPDNGLFTPALEQRDAVAVSLPTPPGASPTFHGRDVFAPAAARLAAGVRIGELGGRLADPVRLPSPRVMRSRGNIIGQVVHVDRFGTLVTNIPAPRIARDATVRIGAYELALKTTFGDVPSGDPAAYVGSGGMVEIAIRDGRADVVMGASVGAEVRATARAADPSGGARPSVS
jgi:S-adenosylmethionine hydrolase